MSAGAGTSAAGASTSASEATPKVERIMLSAKSWVDKFVMPRMHAGAALLPTSLNELWNMHPKELGIVKIFGRDTPTPRWQQSYGRAYSFAGITLFNGPVPAELQRFLDWGNSLPQYGQKFDEVLVNWYEDGHHYIGPHSDDERQLRPGAPILSISLGGRRTFRIRDQGAGRAVRKDIEMPHGTVLVMGGAMQKEFSHEVPKVSGDKGRGCGRRINITLRAFLPEEELKEAAQVQDAAGAGARPSKRRRY